jgi:16S rRNA (guanine966-N2)-methyltransferase
MKHKPNTLRIIGGSWRGRRVAFPDGDGLRPTGDRIRETVFNWLQPYAPGARCLDLFAGSGSMGLEALSRGAESVTFVERNSAATTAIRAALAMLDAGNAQVLQADALRYLDTAAAQPVDIVFVDPPFGVDIIDDCCRLLEQRNWLKPGALVYIEQDKDKPAPSLPDNWIIHRQAQAGQVAYCLARRQDQEN